MKTKTAFWFFIVAAITNVSALVLNQELIARYSKMVLMPFLMYYLVEKSSSHTTKNILLLGIALVFSWIGDLFLIYEDYFLAGVGAFFITQVCYVFLFFRAKEQSAVSLKNTISIRTAILYILYGSVLFYLLIPAAGNLKIPIFIYGISLLLMGYISAVRKNFTNLQSYRWVLYGSTLFILSDSLIAINKFVISIDSIQSVIMLTYLLAQWFIVQGILKHEIEK